MMWTDILWHEVAQGDAEGVQQAIRNGADVNSFCCYLFSTPLTMACASGKDRIVRILLDAGADARWYDPRDGMLSSAIIKACSGEHRSTIELLLQHDKALLELADGNGRTPLLFAVEKEKSEIVQFLMDRGANVYAVAHSGQTTLMYACHNDNLEIAQLLIAAGVDVEARDRLQRVALHYAVTSPSGEVARELILRHNANMFALDQNGDTPLDRVSRSERPAIVTDLFLERYGNKMIEDHGQRALHVVLKVAKYSFVSTRLFHPPLNPLQIILPLGKLTLKHLRTLISILDTEWIRTRDDSGKLPIHIACQTNAPVEVLAILVKVDSATLHIADYNGALPIHRLCGNGAPDEYSSVRYLVEQGGISTLTARNHQGATPLHLLCGSTSPPFQTVQYLIHAFPMSVSMRTNAGEYPFMMAASEASLSVVYELVRVYPFW